MEKDYSYRFYSTTSEAWEAMYKAVQSANKSIYWEVFIFIDDEAGERFIKALCDKARAKVEVKMIIDAMGSFYLSKEAVHRLKQAGVELLIFNRLYPELAVHRWFTRLFYRNHRKVLIVDSHSAFLGGVNVHISSQEWDDLYLRIDGEVIRPLLRGFAKSYISLGGKRSRVRHLLHPKLLKWKELKDTFKFSLHSSLFRRRSSSRKSMVNALGMAKRTINLLTPYYIPDKHLIRAMTQARKRGVEVNLFLPLRTDHKLMEIIARAYYGLTFKTGAKIYFLSKMNHGKGMSVDDTLGSVGSMNITPRSFDYNEESGVYFTDTEMVNDLNAIFNSWKKEAREFDPAIWQKRGQWSKFTEWLARVFERYV